MSSIEISNSEPTPGLSLADRKWNAMWDLWSQDQVPSPIRELISYYSEVNNGGHGQYFCNTEENSDLKAEVETLLGLLPEPLAANLRRGYTAYLLDGDDGAYEEECDYAFYLNEETFNELLQSYADTLEL